MRKAMVVQLFASALLITVTVGPAFAGFKMVHQDRIENWLLQEWEADVPTEGPHCMAYSPTIGNYAFFIDLTSTAPVGQWPRAAIRVKNTTWQIAAGSTGDVVIKSDKGARTIPMKRIDAQTMGQGPWLPANESTTMWLESVARGPVEVKLPHGLGFTMPAAPAGFVAASSKCIEKLVLPESVMRDPFAQPQAKAAPPPAQRSDDHDPFAAASPPASAAVASAAGALRAKPNADQVKAILKAGFDPVPNLIEAPPNKDMEAGFVALDFDHIDGVVGFIETLNAGRTPDQNVQFFKDEQQKKCANTATFQAVSQETIAGIRFDRLTYGCRQPGKEAMNGDLLIASDASRSQSILLLGSTGKDSEIHKRADLIFAGYEKTYR